MKLFGAGKPDHPMAERKEASRLLGELPALDGKALEELGHWHDSLAAAEGFKAEELAQRLAMLDEAARPRLDKTARQYFAAVRSGGAQKAQENLLWTRMHDYWRQAGRAHARAVDALAQAGKAGEKALPGAVLAALRALGQQLKWQHVRSGPIDADVWGLVNRVYALAEARGIGEATAEFLKVALLSTSSPDSLDAAEVELVERLIAPIAASASIAAAPSAELGYWTDLAKPMAPARTTRAPETAASVRWLGAAPAFSKIKSLLERIEGNRGIPSELKLGADYDVETVLEALRHLALHWAPRPPERKHTRRSLKTRLNIRHGFDGVLDALGAKVDSLDFGAKGTESWAVENISVGGFGAIVQQAKNDWLKVGALVAVQPHGAPNWMVGAVRRVSRVSSQEIRVGVQTLSRTPAVSQFGLRSGQAHGVLLPSATPSDGEAAIALRAGVYAAGQSLEASIDGRQHVYMPQGIAERGDDYEIVRFKEMVREA
jgi:hypothetical protein